MECLEPRLIRDTKLKKLVKMSAAGEIPSSVVKEYKRLYGTRTYVPCGRCAACQARNRDSWVFRLSKERDNSISSFFFTLTYEDDFLYKNSQGIPSVCKKHLQDFLKRLRHYVDVRYFIISEYGPDTFRPHYHGILFFNSRLKGHEIFDLLHVTWQKGYVKVGDDVNGNRIGYVSSYCMKDVAFTAPGADKNFLICSRGIGTSYITDNTIEYHNRTVDNTFCRYDGRKFSLPRYLRDKILSSENKEAAYKAYRERFSTLKDKVLIEQGFDFSRVNGYLRGIKSVLNNKLQSSKKSKNKI